MEGRHLPSDSSNASDQPVEKKKVFADWMTLVKLSNEEKEHWAEVTQRLSYTRELSGKITGIQSHGDLAKKLKEKMERTRKTSSGLRSDGSEVQMRAVACPTCTVHLQVQVPTSGSETIECSVCQHPFLVHAQHRT